MIIRMSALILENLKSKVIGILQVFGGWQDHDNAAVKPVFEANPGSDPAGNNGNFNESTTVRGAFRVRKNTKGDAGGETATAEFLPNGQTKVQNLQSLQTDFVYKNFYRIDASALDSTKFYFVSFAPSLIEWDCEIYSPPLSAAEPYNQNRIHFLLTTRGWYDLGISLAVLAYNRYDTNEITIGAIVRGNRGGEKGVYVRGGLAYRIKSNNAPTLRDTQYTNDEEVYPAGVALGGWTGANTTVIWTYTDGGPYFREKLLLNSARIAGAASTSPSTGALAVAGGAGIAGALNVGDAASFTRVNGDMIEFYQGGVMKAAIKLGMMAGALSLLLACENIVNQGNIKAEMPNPVPSDWTAATLPSTAYYRSVTYGNGKFVTVSDYGDRAAYSTDGITWQPATLPSAANWYSVTYGNGKFVTVSDKSNQAAYSTDGITWQPATLPSSAGWNGVTYGNGKFVVVAFNSNQAAYSTDGINWTAATMPSTANWNSVTYGDPSGQEKFVVVAFNSDKAAYYDAIVLAKLVFNANGSVTWVKA
jgi:hypothetical protein